MSVLFETDPGSDASRIRRSGLSRTTYQAARKRLYDRGLVSDCYLPHPPTFGFPMATLLLAVPYAENLSQTAQAIFEDPASVVVWSGRHIVLGVLLHRSAEASARSVEKTANHAGGSVFYITANIEQSTVPCYFDFEGAWKKLHHEQGLNGYPRPLGGPVSETFFGGRFRPSDGESAHQMICGSTPSSGAGDNPRIVAPHLLPRSQRKLLQRSWVQWRVFPSVTGLPALAGAGATDVIFVAGRTRSGTRSVDLFERLAGESHAYPFLYATDGEKLLLGALGAGEGARRTRPDGSRGRSVMDTVRGHLEGISVFREQLRALNVMRDHQYCRVISAAKGA